MSVSILLLWAALLVQSIILFVFIRLVVQFLNRFRINEKRAEAITLSIGEKAPFFKEKDQYGEVVQLQNAGEKHTLMLFSNDSCGTCKAIIPELAYVQTQNPDLRIIIVSQRIHYEQEGELPNGVHLIRSDDLMSKYLIQAVPTAIHIDQSGVIVAIRQVSAYQDIFEMLDMSVDKVS